MKKAFTLAEVLITLLVIGIVAIVTIPSLVRGYKERVVVTTVKKFYNTFTQAYTLAVLENGTPDNWGLSGDPQDYDGHKKLFGMFAKYMKNVEIIDTTNNGVRKVGMIMPGGVVIFYYPRSSNCTYWLPKNDGCGDLWISVPGVAANFYLTKNGIIPYGTGQFNWYYDSVDAQKAGRCTGCWTAWILKYENLDFLKCPEELSWNGNYKCSK